MGTRKGKVIVLGLGNRLHCDAGVGLRAIEQLRNDPRLPNGIVILDRDAPSLELLPELWDCARLCIVTAVDAVGPPGTLVHLRGEQLRSLETRANRNQLAILALYEALHLLSREPPQVCLFGVQAQSICRGIGLSALVDTAIRTLIEKLIAELGTNTDANL